MKHNRIGVYFSELNATMLSAEAYNNRSRRICSRDLGSTHLSPGPQGSLYRDTADLRIYEAAPSLDALTQFLGVAISRTVSFDEGGWMTAY